MKPLQPLNEVFGYPPDNYSDEARRHRKMRLCPFGNVIANCTKDKANDPLGVCSISTGSTRAITCPIRFRENWLVAEHAAEFFFQKHATWTSLTEVRLSDAHGQSAGNIDVVLAEYNRDGKVVDFGALEIQAVYISGNIRRPFSYYMEHQEAQQEMDWSDEQLYPRPDYLSSSRKRLVPQLLFKSGILKAWGKKSAVALDAGFFNTLPVMRSVSPDKADLIWLVYDLEDDPRTGRQHLAIKNRVYTLFQESLDCISTSEPGDIELFVRTLQQKVDEVLDTPIPPDNKLIRLDDQCDDSE